MYEKYKHLRWFRFLVIATSVLEIPFTATYFGWPPLVYIMKSEQYFTDIKACEPSVEKNTTSNLFTSLKPQTPPLTQNELSTLYQQQNTTCRDQQDFIYTTLFQASDITQFLTALLFGIFFDTYGTHMMRHLCSIMLGIGTLCGWLLVTPGWVSFYRNQWVLYFTMLCLGFGSVPLFITNNQLGYLFPKKYESIITYNNGMFDMGDGVTLIPKLLHQKFGLGLNFWFFCFFIAVIYVTIRTVVFMPKMFVGKDDFSEKAIDEEKVELKATIDLAANSEISETVVQTSKSKKEAAEPAELPPVSTKQIFQWFRMPEFFCLVPFLTFYVTNLSFFHQALNAWLMEISGGDDYFVSWMTDIFAYLQPMALVFSQTGGFLIGQVQNIYKRKNTTLPDSQKFTGMNIKRKGIVFYMFTVMTSILVTNVLLAIASMTNLYRNTPFMVVLFLFEVWGRTSFFSILDIFFLTEFPVNAYGRVLGVSQFLWAAIAPINQILLKVAQNTRDWDFFLKGYPLVMFFYFCCVMATGLYGMWRYNRATIEYSDLIFVTKESENGRE